VSQAADNPRRHLERNGLLAGLVGGAGGARRAFVDATGASVTTPPVIRRLVATDAEVGALLLNMGAPVVGCAGALNEIEVVGAPRLPDPKAVAALRPDVIVTGAVERAHDLSDMRLVAALRQVAPVVAVDVGGPARAAADLRALLGPAVGGGRPATEPVSGRRVGAPTYDRPRQTRLT
jgi:ABC-type Fe2+-enterobactin transport system substrate-binding protein